MHFTNFSGLIHLIKTHLQPVITTYELINNLFEAYLTDNGIYLEHSQTSLWSRGKRPIPAHYMRYYQNPKNFAYLEDAIREKVLPYVSDIHNLEQNIDSYIHGDLGMSDALKEHYLMQLHGYAWLESVIANLLLYAMQERIILKCALDSSEALDDENWF